MAVAITASLAEIAEAAAIASYLSCLSFAAAEEIPSAKAPTESDKKYKVRAFLISTTHLEDRLSRAYFLLSARNLPPAAPVCMLCNSNLLLYNNAVI